VNNSSPAIIDTHAHLDDDAFDNDRADVLERGRAAGVRHFLNIAYRPDIWQQSVDLREEHPDVELAAGIHPQDAAVFSTAASDGLAERLIAMRPLGIGEAGFDFARSGPSLEEQEAAFRWQIELALDTRLPLIIHQREASAQLMQELDRWPQLEMVVLHSFDGDGRLAAWALERGFFVGIGGLACRKGSHPLREALTTIPVDRLLLETDAPYLAPPGSPSRRNEPANLPIVAETLASLWSVTPDELCKLTTANAQTVFRFHGSR
jgi:TatD DNase family protein